MRRVTPPWLACAVAVSTSLLVWVSKDALFDKSSVITKLAARQHASNALTHDAWAAWNRLKAGKDLEPHAGALTALEFSQLVPLHPINLSYWQTTKPTEKAMAKFWDTLGGARLMWVHFDGHGHCDIVKHTDTSAVFNTSSMSMLAMLRDVAKLAPMLKGSVLYYSEDGMAQPCSCQITAMPPVLVNDHCHKCAAFVPIPDWQWAQTRGYLAARHAIDKVPPLAWSEKKKRAIWHGSTTGVPTSMWCDDPGGNFWCLRPELQSKVMELSKEVPRFKVMAAAKAHPDLIDAGWSRILQCFVNQSAPSFVPVYEQAAYELLINVDGNGAAWSDLFWKLYSHSAVLKVDSAAQCQQWFHPSLEAGSEYIPVRADQTDLIARIQAALHDANFTSKVAEHGRLFAEKLTYKSELRHTAAVLKQLFEIMR